MEIGRTLSKVTTKINDDNEKKAILQNFNYRLSLKISLMKIHYFQIISKTLILSL